METSSLGDARSGRFLESSHRAQGAMEYFITYSWMLIVLVIVVGALYTLGIGNPTSFTNNRCTPQGDFVCTNTTMFTSGNFAFTLGQSTSSPIYVTAIGCNTVASTANMMTYNVFLPIGNNMTTYVQCYSGSTPFTGSVGKIIFNGYLMVNYTSINTGISQTVIASVTQKVASSNLHP